MFEGIFNLVHPKKCEILNFFEDGTESKISSEIMQVLNGALHFY